MEEVVLTKDQLKDVIEKAFKAGESWGCTHSTWFIPSEEDYKRNLDKAVENILEFWDGACWRDNYSVTTVQK